MKKSLYIAVIGCGRLGSILASDLSQQGYYVIVIDKDPSAFDRLREEFSGFSLTGDAAEMTVLQAAKLNQAQVAIAVTGKDNLNIMVSQLAKTIFKIPIVLTRIFEPTKDEIYQKLGLTAISPTKISAQVFIQAFQQQLQEMEL